MRVLMLSDVFFPRVNGVSTSIQTFRQGLAEEGVEVRLIAPDYGQRDSAAEVAWITRVPSRRVPFDPEDRLVSKRQMVEAGQAQQASLIHIQTPFAAHYAGLELARRNRLPVIATYHTLFEEYLHHYVPLVPGALTRRLARTFSRRQCNALDAVVVPSSAMAERLREYGVTVPLHVLPTGIPIDRFMRGNREAFRRAHHIPDHLKVALFVGRIAHEKNIDFLLQVARLTRESQPDLLWVIAGEGPALPDLKARAASLGIADRVRFIGYLDRTQGLPDCYAGADAFVFASRTETQGLVLLEAMASGLPVVALSAMGTTDIVEPRMGAIVARDEVADFADQLSALLADDARRLGMCHVAKLFARRWSEHATAINMNAVYRRVRFNKLSQIVRDDDLAAA
jgi:1,2-diacylglycerol 3-alpha-glucosyltransferase